MELPSLKNEKCYIIASGPSLTDLNFKFESISNNFTIGLNRNFEFYQTDILHCNDQEFYQRIVTGDLDSHAKKEVFKLFKSFSGIKVFPYVKCHTYLHDVVCIKRSFESKIRTDLNCGVYLGTNSGFGAIMLAIALGCSDIGLVGYDMKVAQKTHCHNGYPKQTLESYNNRLIEKFKPEMEEWAPKFKESGISITQYVIRDDSETSLRCFPIERLP